MTSSDRPDPASGQPRGNPHGEIGTAWSTPRGGPRPPADAQEPGPSDGPQRASRASGGGVAFAGTLLLCAGLLAVFQGVSALGADDVYARVGSFVYELSLTGWGWIHLVLGALAAATGAGLLRAAAWARPAGVFLAALSLVAQFLFLPYQPLWAIVVMGLDVFVIWALTSHDA